MMTLSEARQWLQVLNQRRPRQILDSRFVKQNNFITDESRLKAALCTRRAGKSYGDGLYLFDVARNHNGVKCLYIALTRDSAKKIMWNDVLKDIARKFDIKCKTNEVELSITLENGSIIQLVGADAKPQEIEKNLGQKFKLVIIDEAGSFRQDVKKMVYEILEPATIDNDGTICLTGTPTDLVSSFFHDVTNTSKEQRWSVHKWSALDNPYIADKFDKAMKERLERDPMFIETPEYKRMYLGEWYIDANKLVYRFDRLRNVYKDRKDNTYFYVLGVDIGYEDASAFSVVSYADNDPVLYVVETYKKSQMIVEDVAKAIAIFQKKYPLFKIIIDGANKQAVQELVKRYGIPLTNADKTGKSDFIEMMNSDYILRKILLKEDCVNLMDEYAGLIWDDRNMAKKQEHPSCKNDLCDATLYAWRFCYNYAWKEREKPVDIYGQQGIDLWEQKELELIESEKNKESLWS